MAETPPETRPTDTEWAVRYTIARYDGSELVEVWTFKNREYAEDSLTFGPGGSAVVVRREVTEWEEA